MCCINIQHPGYMHGNEQLVNKKNQTLNKVFACCTGFGVALEREEAHTNTNPSTQSSASSATQLTQSVTQIRELYAETTVLPCIMNETKRTQNHQHMVQFFPPLACGKLMITSNSTSDQRSLSRGYLIKSFGLTPLHVSLTSINVAIVTVLSLLKQSLNRLSTEMFRI